MEMQEQKSRQNGEQIKNQIENQNNDKNNNNDSQFIQEVNKNKFEELKLNQDNKADNLEKKYKNYFFALDIICFILMLISSISIMLSVFVEYKIFFIISLVSFSLSILFLLFYFSLKIFVILKDKASKKQENYKLKIYLIILKIILISFFYVISLFMIIYILKNNLL